MFEELHRTDEISASDPESAISEVLSGGRPTVIRGAARDWPLVRAALRSDEAAVAYLNRFYNGQPVNTIVAPPSAHGRFFYQGDTKQLNFQRSAQQLSSVLSGLLQLKKSDQSPAIAMQAILVAECLPALEAENPNSLVPKGTPARLWIGNRVTVAPHFDVSDNVACVIAGRRRFILFPPEQTPNLYPGPMDETPANVSISMVSLDRPELDRFPRYHEAMEAALGAELQPGDAIYIPYLWWHGVQSLGSFNILMNYWWSRNEVASRHPYWSFLHLAYSLYRDMPAEQRQAWRALYDHYVFQTGGDPTEALPPGQRYRGRTFESERIARLKDMLRELLS